VRFSRNETDVAECSAQNVVEVGAERIFGSPCLNNHQSTIVRITQVHHQSFGGTADVLESLLDCALQTVMITLVRCVDEDPDNDCHGSTLLIRTATKPRMAARWRSLAGGATTTVRTHAHGVGSARCAVVRSPQHG
jgi:hypothetical protein